MSNRARWKRISRWFFPLLLLLLGAESLAASIAGTRLTMDEPKECQTKDEQQQQQCPLSGLTLEEVERSLEERMARAALFNAGRGQPSLGGLMAREAVGERSSSSVEVDQEEEGEGWQQAEGEELCRPGDLVSNNFCTLIFSNFYSTYRYIVLVTNCLYFCFYVY